MDNQANKSKVTDFLILLTTVVGVLGTIFLLVPKVACLLAFPYEYGYGESIILDRVARLSSFKSMYPLFSEMPPYCLSYYTPLFHFVQVPFFLMFGPAYWFGRLIALFALVVVIVMMFLIMKNLTGNIQMSILPALFFVLSPPVIYTSALSRPDFLAMAFSLTALLYLIRNPNSRSIYLFSILFFLAAFYTKQTYFLAGMTAAFVWLVHQSGFQRGISFLLFLSAMIAASFLVINWATSGGLYLHTVVANQNRYSIYALYGLFRKFVIFSPILFLSASIFFGYGLFRRTKLWFFGAAYLAGSFIISLTGGNVGADWNHCLELSAALSMAAVLLFLKIQNPTLKLLIATFFLLHVGYSIFVGQKQFVARQTLSTKGGLHGWDQLRDEVRKAKVPIMTDSAMGFLPLDHREIFFEPFGMSQLSLFGKWDQKPIIQMMAERKFSVAIIRVGGSRNVRFSKEMLKTLLDNYVEVKRIETGLNVHSVYYPKPAQH